MKDLKESQVCLQEILKGISSAWKDRRVSKPSADSRLSLRTRPPCVARVRYGFGGGFGKSDGGGADVPPIGVAKTATEETKYVTLEERGRLISAGFALGLIAMFILGRMLLRKRRNKQ